jgi:acetoin utilization protein AcuB
MQVRDIMTTNPHTARTTTTIFDAMSTLENEQIRHLPVVQEGELVGIVSDRDLLRFSHMALVKDPDAARTRLQLPLAEIMSGEPEHVGPDDDIDDAIDLMIENRVGALPVVDEAEGRLVGIVSYVDILRAARGNL